MSILFMPSSKNRTKIIATIGPASEKQAVLEEMMKAGMDVCRLNFSHGTLEHHTFLIKNIRRAAKKLKLAIAIMADLQGPRMRVGELPADGMRLKQGDKVVLTCGQPLKKEIPVTFPLFCQVLRPGNIVFFDNGLIELKVQKVSKGKIYCQVRIGGILKSKKGINLPASALKIPAMTPKDKKDLIFGLKQRVDFIALSFVTEAQDIKDLRDLIKQNKKPGVLPKIVAKIEKPAAVKNFPAILEEADEIMIARGDLGVEMPLAELPVIQKQLIGQCLKKSKPVIVATQMLESMINNPQPTRAEVSDVANAVIDRADALMLSGETAIGKYPVEAVKMMDKIIRETEASPYDDILPAK